MPLKVKQTQIVRRSAH